MILILTYTLMAGGVVQVAQVKVLTGKVIVKRNEKKITLKIGSKLYESDLIITKENSSIGIMFSDGTRVSLDSKSIFSIKKFLVDPVKKEYDVDVSLLKGKASFSSGKIGELSPESVKFHIPEGIIGIRGTHFMVEV